MDSVTDRTTLDTQPRTPRISVVIPTRGRPQLVERAVKSALRQSLAEIEVIVVIDGCDAATEEALAGFHDPRLHVLPLRKNVGGSQARNIGVQFSRSRWIALLDDDDEWFPDKLAIQLKAAESVEGHYVFVASRFVERTEGADRTLPRRRPAPDEPFSEYLFARKGWTSGETFLQTSTWFVSRELLMKHPFLTGLKRCQDLDWLLHAMALPATRVVIVPEILAVFHHDEHGSRVSRSADWEFLYSWATANRHLLTAKAFSFFVATFCAPSAAKQGAGWRIFLLLLRECVFKGSPSWKCLALFFACWFVPEGLRRNLRGYTRSLRSRLASKLSPVVGEGFPSEVI